MHMAFRGQPGVGVSRGLIMPVSMLAFWAFQRRKGAQEGIGVTVTWASCMPGMLQ
jgi:hypothetical protein